MAAQHALICAAEVTQANAQARLQDSRFLGLPNEVREKILLKVTTDGNETLRPSTTRQSVYGVRKQELDISFKTAYSRLLPLIAASKELRDECYQYLGKEVALKEENSNILLFQHREAYWSKKLLARIQKLVVGMSQGMKLRGDQMWGQYLQFFVALMPELIHLELYTEFHHNDQPFPRKMSGEPLGNVERLDQERRCKLFFLAYLTLRHPSLNRIVQPAASGPTWEEGQNKIRHYLIAERSFNETSGDRDFIWETKTKKASEDVDATVHEDEVLNATLIRRYYYTALCSVSDLELIIQPQYGKGKNNIPSSEVDYPDQNFYEFVDSRAYRTRGCYAKKGWKAYSADELLDICTEFPRREKYAAFAVAVAKKSIEFWKGTMYTDFAMAVNGEAGNLDLRNRDAETRARGAFRIRGRGWAITSYKREYKILLKTVEDMVDDRQWEIDQELAEEERRRREIPETCAEDARLGIARPEGGHSR